jgi:HlyD family secretion protein
MNTNPTSSESGRASSRKLALWSVLGLLVAGAIGSVVFYYASRAGAQQATGEFFTVARSDLIIKVLGNGTANPLHKIVIKSEVEGRNTIDYLVPQGPVKKDRVLVRLNTSNLENEIADQEIRVRNAGAAKIRAEENLAVTQSQNRSDISKAKLDLEFAKQDLTKYIQGEYPQELAKAEADITIASVELRRAEDKLGYSRDLHEKGFITRTELEADSLSVTRAKLDKKLAQGRKNLLETYTYQQQTQLLESDIEQAEMNLERVQRKANADEIQAKADLDAKTTEHTRQEERFEKLKAQKDKCVIKAPTDGEVVYATTTEGRWHRSSTETLEEGKEVREGQEIIHMPQPGAVKVEVKINESDIALLRQAVDENPNRLPVRVTTGVNDRVYWGELVSVSPNASQASFWSGGARQYDAEVHISRDVEGLEAGMPVEAMIVIEKLQDVLYVPLQAVVREGKQDVVYVANGGGIERRVVTLGRNDNTNVHIVAGLEAGQEVSLHPPLDRARRTSAESAGEQDAQAKSIPQTSRKTGKESPENSEKSQELTFEKFKAMTAQQRKKLMEKMGREKIMRFFQSLTDEQKKQLRDAAGGSGNGGRGEGRPGRSDPNRGGGR